MEVQYKDNGNIILIDENGENEYIPMKRIEQIIDDAVDYNQKKKLIKAAVVIGVIIIGIIVIVIRNILKC